jgi:GxxExxY protein
MIAPDVEAAAREAVDALFQLHTTLGPGLLENVYSSCLEEEFKHRGIRYVREMAIPVEYRSRRLEVGFRADFIVEGKLLVELKTVETILPVHLAQTITYLKLTGLPLGLLANLNVNFFREGIRRLFNPSLS